MSAERAKVSEQICSANTMEELANRLDRMNFDYSISNGGLELNAIKTIHAGGLISSSLLIDVKLSRGGKLKQCKVSVAYTGP